MGDDSRKGHRAIGIHEGIPKRSRKHRTSRKEVQEPPGQCSHPRYKQNVPDGECCAGCLEEELMHKAERYDELHF